MSDSVRVTTHQGWLSRIGGAFTGALIGFVLVAASLVLLFWNEGRAVQTARSLAEGAQAVVSTASETVDAANEGRLVHLSGRLSTAQRPADPSFGISAESVRLVRNVEMFQWRETSRSETQKQLGGGEETVTTYSYDRGWESTAVDSSEFKQPMGHTNPPMTIRGETFAVDAAKVGAFDLYGPALNAISWSEKLALAPNQIDAVKAAYSGPSKVSVSDGGIYLGTNPASPRIGDTRITYSTVPLGPVSLVARQHGSSLDAYQTLAGDRLLLASPGTLPADQMFADAVAGNTVLTWILRFVGFLLLGIGFALILAPVGVLADVVPLFGSIVRIGTGAVAFLLTVVSGSVVVAIAWFWYRPLVALCVLAVGLVIGFGVSRLLRRKKPDAGTPSAPQPAAA